MSTPAYLTRLLRAHRGTIHRLCRKLSCARQALLVLAHLCGGNIYTWLAAGFGIGVATVYRYVREAVGLLAARAPSLTAALWALAWTFNTYARSWRHRGMHRPAGRGEQPAVLLRVHATTASI